MSTQRDLGTPTLRGLVQALTVGMLTILVSLGAALNGCGSNPLPPASTTSSARGSVALNHTLSGVNPDATQFVYSGFNDSGGQVYGPVTMPRSSRNVLTGIPIEVRMVTVEFRTDAGLMMLWGSTPVQVSEEVVSEATPMPAAGSTVLQVENTTATTARMAFSAYILPANLDNLEVFDLDQAGPVKSTPMPDQSNWRYIDMPAHEKYELYSIEPDPAHPTDPPKNVLNSFLVAFGDPQVFKTQPYCPGTFGLYPNGINYFEATLNVPTPETIDLSLNQGANSYLAVQCSPTPTASPTPVPGWTTNYGHDAVSSFRSSFLNVVGQFDDNCCLPGVFAYGLSNCNGGPSSCTGGDSPAGPFCSNDAVHCQVQRANGQQGGIVLVQFQGLIDVTRTPTPAACP